MPEIEAPRLDAVVFLDGEVAQEELPGGRHAHEDQGSAASARLALRCANVTSNGRSSEGTTLRHCLNLANHAELAMLLFVLSTRFTPAPRRCWSSRR